MGESRIQVRYAKPDDIETIVRFNIELAYDTENIVLSRQKLFDGVTAMFKDPLKGFYVIAECDGVVVGQTMITYEWSDWRNAIFWWIQSVYVLPDYRKTGVLRSIFEQIKSLAMESNVCGLRLYVYKDNNAAKKAYQSLGMEESHYEFYEMMLTSG
jgi:GNAT superfamily N-acetyltransferase